MRGFTFLQPTQRSLFDRLRDVEIDAHARRAAVLLIGAISIIVFAEGVEQIRLSQAHAVERDRTARLQNDERRMVDLRASVETVAKLSTVAASIRSSQRSGDREAAQLSEIAASLPEHLWLTSIRQDPSGLVLRGGARNFALLGDAMERLAGGRAANTPTLISSGMRDTVHPDSPAFELRLQEHAQ